MGRFCPGCRPCGGIRICAFIVNSKSSKNGQGIRTARLALGQQTGRAHEPYRIKRIGPLSKSGLLSVVGITSDFED